MENQMQVFTENTNLVGYIVSKLNLHVPGYETEDFIQIGQIALWEAIINFDESKGVKFSTAATTYIRNAVLGPLYHYKKSQRDKEVGCYGLSEDAYNLMSYTNVENEVEAKVLIQTIFSSIDERSAYLLREIYVKGRSQKSIAEEFGVVYGTVSYWVREAENKAKKAIGDISGIVDSYKMKNSLNMNFKNKQRSNNMNNRGTSR